MYLCAQLFYSDMKHQLLCAALLLLACGAQVEAKAPKKKTPAEPVVMNIAGKDVTAKEFLYFYNKNTQQEADAADKKNFDEYVDLFVNYKLKVAEAVSRGVDTTQAYIDELAGYRKQLIEPYMAAENWADAAVDEVIERQKQEVHAAHILFECGPKATPDEVAKALDKIADVRRQLAEGANFDSLARAVSEDPSARQNGGDLGYFSALMMVYPFEEAAFNTPVGEVGECRSSFGFHLVKVIDRRPSRGEVKVAHIMRSFPRTMPPAQAKEATKHVIDSAYQVLKGGRPFAEVCAEVSDDAYTAKKGGEYDWVSATSRFPKEWLDVAFSLEKGQISEPFATQFGWHIMTLIDKRESALMTDEERAQLKKRLEQDSERKAAAAKKQLERWAAEEQLAWNEKMRAGALKVLADTALTTEKLNAQMGKLKKPLLTFGTERLSALQLAAWVTEKYGASDYNFTDAAQLLSDWRDEQLSAYEDAHMAEKNEEFGNLYREYHDGLLLFDVASKEVWDKASNDTVGLERYFEAHRANYNWNAPRFKGAFIECVEDEALIAKLTEIYSSTDSYKAAAARVRAEVLTDTLLTPDPKHPRFHIVNGLYAPGDNATVDRDQLHVAGAEVKPRATMPFQMTYGRVLNNGPEGVEDVRSAVVNDYQNELEAAWIKALRAKFEVLIYQEELDKVKN